jgi:prophage regulatory protein
MPAAPTRPDGPERILRLREVLNKTGLSRSSLYRRIDQGRFPRQVKIAERCVGWRQSELNGWLADPFFYTVEDGTIS